MNLGVSNHEIDKKSTEFLIYLDKRNISHTNKRKSTLCHDERKCPAINEFPELSYIADLESLN